MQLKEVLLAVSKQDGHTPEANSRALARAAQDDTLRLVTEPFSADADFVRSLSRRLSIQQRPVDTFRIEFLTGQIPKNQEELEAQKRRKKW